MVLKNGHPGIVEMHIPSVKAWRKCRSRRLSLLSVIATYQKSKSLTNQHSWYISYRCRSLYSHDCWLSWVIDQHRQTNSPTNIAVASPIFGWVFDETATQKQSLRTTSCSIGSSKHIAVCSWFCCAFGTQAESNRTGKSNHFVNLPVGGR